MVDKKTEDKNEKDPFSDSSEIFESIFKEATQETQGAPRKAAAQPGLKSKPRVEVKPQPEIKPKAPIKLELEAKEEPKPKAELKREKPRYEQKPGIRPQPFKPRQEPLRKPITRTPAPHAGETQKPLLPSHRLARDRIREQQPKEEPSGKAKPKPPRKKGRSSPLLKILLLLVLLAAGVAGASVYLGIIDLSGFIGGTEPAKTGAPKVAAAKPSSPPPAAKPQKPAAPKAGQPASPQAKPSEAPKPPVPPPAVQPPQAPPKAAETVTPRQPSTPPAPPAVVPPQPPEVQAKPAQPPAPPAIAKAETPPPPIPPPVKVQPPPAPVPPPVSSQPQGPPQPAQAPVKSQAPVPPPPVAKSEPKVSPAPVQPPAVPKKMEPPQPASQPKEAVVAKTLPPVTGSGVGYPYSVYLGSVQGMDYVKKGMSTYESEGLSAYWSKVDLGARGTWYRLFTGYFRSAEEAEAFIRQKKIKDGEVKETRYTNLIGTFGSKQAGEEKALALEKLGLSAYWIPALDGQVRVYSGAFITKEGAEKHQSELSARGVKSEIVER